MWNCTHFRQPTDEQLGHVYIYIFSNYYNLQSVYFEFDLDITEYNPENCLFPSVFYSTRPFTLLAFKTKADSNRL